MKRLISLLLLLAMAAAMLVLPVDAAAATATVSFGPAEHSVDTLALGAVYDENGKMLLASTPYWKNGIAYISIPEALRGSMDSAKLFFLQDDTLQPLHAPLTTNGPAIPAPTSEDTLAVVVTGDEYTEVTTVADMVAAIDAKGTSVVVLQKDVTHTAATNLPVCTLDLNGYTWTAKTVSDSTTTWYNTLYFNDSATDDAAVNLKSVLKNGTVIGKIGVSCNVGALTVSGVTVVSNSGAGIQLTDSTSATSFAKGLHNDSNVIENSVIYSANYAAVIFNSSSKDFSAVEVTVRNSDLIGMNGEPLSCNARVTASGSYVLGKDVDLYTVKSSYVKTTSPAPGVTGEAVFQVGSALSHSITVNGIAQSGLSKWTTSRLADPEDDVDPILWARREAAEAYLRELCAVRWRSDVDLTYTHTGNGEGSRWKIVKGRLYEGLPYSYSGGSLGMWLDHPGTMDEDGVYNMTGLSVALVGGNSTTSRLGIDCSGTLSHAWQSIGAQVRTESTNAMTPNNGFLKVGEYEAPEDAYTATKTDCQSNGESVMYEAYALLQKADGIVTSNSSGHARFVVDVHVVRNADGTIDGASSSVTVIEQYGIMSTEAKYYDEAIGEDVYLCMTVDKAYSFSNLYSTGYLPVTCKVLTDPTPIADPVVTDSVTTPTKANLFTGTLSSTWALDNVTITITDASGKTVQSSLLHPQRRTELAVKMSQFTTDMAAGKTVGTIDLSQFSSGSYHCAVTVRTVAGHTLTARSFDFTV